MGMYRDSKLGLCIDITGPDGNIFVLWGYGLDLARQIDQEKEWAEAREAAKALNNDYRLQVNVFREFFQYVVTLIGYDEIMELENKERGGG